MHCESIKLGVDCTFMTKKGCSFNGGKCRPVVESCEAATASWPPVRTVTATPFPIRR